MWNSSRLRVLSILLVCCGLAACQQHSADRNNLHVQAQNNASTRVHQYNPAAAGINVRLGIAYLQQGDVDRAKLKLKLALEQDPNSPLVLDSMAFFLEQTGETQAAEKHYQRALTLGKSRGSAKNNYATFLCRQGRLQEAEQYFLAAVADPEYLTPAEALENAGLCALKYSDESRSEQYFTRALQKQPRLPNSLLELAQIKYNQGQYVKAHNYLQRYAQYATPQAESLWLAIRVAYALEDRSEVISNAKLLKQQFVDSEEYQDYLAAEKTL